MRPAPIGPRQYPIGLTTRRGGNGGRIIKSARVSSSTVCPSRFAHSHASYAGRTSHAHGPQPNCGGHGRNFRIRRYAQLGSTHVCPARRSRRPNEHIYPLGIMRLSGLKRSLRTLNISKQEGWPIYGVQWLPSRARINNGRERPRPDVIYSM